MRYPSRPHRRRSIRLKGYDYSRTGAYFVTISTQNRQCLFGEVVDGIVQLNTFGEIVRDEWLRTADIRPNVELDMFVVMPNHIHGIIVLRDNDGGGTLHGRGVSHGGGTLQRAPTTIEQFGKPTSNSIPTIVRLFKSATTKNINERRETPGAPVWQRNYYEHIIRDEPSFNRIRGYILDNPLRWQFDRENPNASGADIWWEKIIHRDRHTGMGMPHGGGTLHGRGVSHGGGTLQRAPTEDGAP